MPTRCTYDGGGGRCVLRKEHKGPHRALGLAEGPVVAQKFARYHGKPFECGTAVEYKPGWYTFEEGAFAATVQEYEPNPSHDHSQTMHVLARRGYAILEPIERDA